MPEAPIRDGLTLAFTEDGPTDAPVLLLVTGLGGLKEGWFRQAPLAERFRLVTFDNRGMGGSSVLDVPTTMYDLAEDAVLLLDHLGIGAAHVWGVSMGGKIAQEMALGWPERVDRLVLENTTAGEESRVEGRQVSVLQRLDGMTADEILEEVVPLLFGREYRERNARSMAAFARSRARNRPDPRGVAHQWEAWDAFEAWGRLPAIPHRTLVLVGAEDGLCDPRNGERLADRLPDAVLRVVEGGGHSVHIEKPREVNDLVADFLSAGG